jgi:aryl-alcohol dehydrogenase-like predicted oxidoreductase
MNTRSLGLLDVSVVGIGCNNFGARIDQQSTTQVVEACLDAGINFFDTADSYGDGLSEEYLGRALGSRRQDVVIATKFGWEFKGDPPGGGASAAWVETAVEGSLRRLNTDYIDLYQLHRPDDATPVDETLEALDRLVTSGKVREVGCSNMSAAQIDEGRSASKANEYAAWTSVQNQYSLLHRDPEAGVLDACASHGMGFLPYFPLHSGLLTGKYSPGGEFKPGTRLAAFPKERIGDFYNDDALQTVDRLRRFCDAHGRTLLELAFSWLLARDPVVSVIAGATRPEQVAANAAAASWELSVQDLSEVDALLGAAN